MEKSRKFVLKLLKYLEKIFPQDMATAHKDTWNYVGTFDRKVIQTLIDNGLIEEKEYSLRGLPENMPNKAVVYKITSAGIGFLNGRKQKITNGLLLALTIILTIIGIIQIILLVR